MDEFSYKSKYYDPICANGLFIKCEDKYLYKHIIGYPFCLIEQCGFSIITDVANTEKTFSTYQLNGMQLQLMYNINGKEYSNGYYIHFDIPLYYIAKTAFFKTYDKHPSYFIKKKTEVYHDLFKWSPTEICNIIQSYCDKKIPNIEINPVNKYKTSPMVSSYNIRNRNRTVVPTGDINNSLICSGNHWCVLWAFVDKKNPYIYLKPSNIDNTYKPLFKKIFVTEDDILKLKGLYHTLKRKGAKHVNFPDDIMKDFPETSICVMVKYLYWYRTINSRDIQLNDELYDTDDEDFM